MLGIDGYIDPMRLSGCPVDDDPSDRPVRRAHGEGKGGCRMIVLHLRLMGEHLRRQHVLGDGSVVVMFA
jgi:hypothetical protein